MSEAKCRKQLDSNYGQSRQSAGEFISAGELVRALYPLLGRGAIVNEAGHSPWYVVLDRDLPEDDPCRPLLQDYDPKREYVVIEVVDEWTRTMICPLDFADQLRIELSSGASVDDVVAQLVEGNSTIMALALQRWAQEDVRNGNESR